MINVSEVITDPDFAQSFVVHRKSNTWAGGRSVPSEIPINMTGIVTVADAKTLEQLPEGDRVTGLMCFYSIQELFTTREQGTSDQIEWRKELYRVKQVFPYGDYGYYKAVGERMAGD
ncbi:hypothetical protein [Brevibacillus laterosporus]|uniref:hypothetical protein n=1 Tax=Brevibacillus laterosporus TaxID=1465 RepID=UPI0018F87530|nr:hypothetical protein [Brevibacillus laterosporus]MBG9773565.1 hypothetical protein [Brevibacillus laterosporus]